MVQLQVQSRVLREQTVRDAEMSSSDRLLVLVPGAECSFSG
jgi:hypothetical protein